MTTLIYPLASEVTLSNATGSNVGLATSVYLINTHTGAVTVSVLLSDDLTTVGSLTLAPNQSMALKKYSDHKLKASVNAVIKATKIGIRH